VERGREGRRGKERERGKKRGRGRGRGERGEREGEAFFTHPAIPPLTHPRIDFSDPPHQNSP